MPYTLAVIGCTKRCLVLAEAAVECGIAVTVCVDGSDSRARRAAREFGAVPLRRMEEALGKADLLLLAPSPKPSQNGQKLIHEPFACSNRRESVLLTYNDFPFHAGLTALARQSRDGAIGTPGFVRLRYTATPDAFEAGPVFLFDWLLRAASNPVQVFAQRVERGRRAAQLIATLTLADGSIAQINISAQRNAEPRMEAEIVGTKGLVAYDSRDEVLALLPQAAARGALDHRPLHGFWRLFLDLIDDPNYTSRAAADRNLRVKRIVRRMTRSISTGRPVSIEGLEG